MQKERGDSSVESSTPRKNQNVQPFHIECGVLFVRKIVISLGTQFRYQAEQLAERRPGSPSVVHPLRVSALTASLLTCHQKFKHVLTLPQAQETNCLFALLSSTPIPDPTRCSMKLNC